jgi:hypothetical protein
MGEYGIPELRWIFRLAQGKASAYDAGDGPVQCDNTATGPEPSSREWEATMAYRKHSLHTAFDVLLGALALPL